MSYSIYEDLGKLRKQIPQPPLVFILLSLFLISGCAKPYRITHDLESRFEPGKTCVIGNIIDEFPVGVAEDQKPTVEEVAKFRDYLAEEVQKSEILTLCEKSTEFADYRIQAAILWYVRGSGAERALIGHFGVGYATCLVRLKLVDNDSGNTVFAGNFRAVVDHPFVSGNTVFRDVSKDFCKQLEQRLEKLRKEAQQT